MKLVTLEKWSSLNFDPPPSLNTVRKWVREGRIEPAPIKHGRSYYVEPAARYVPIDRPRIPPGSLIERIMAERVLHLESQSRRRNTRER
ncbi:excisionase [Pseudomonas sp. BN515]|uniref:excisionase n=1 Tax=Pseudomonas sp. BN515 TaxID=2567892 RepID=UPI002453AB8E|nr:excisionase [Pseudomonas sp. BN515]MDH4871993.1 excisionase [Pseudomonas sp. BN515]